MNDAWPRVRLALPIGLGYRRQLQDRSIVGNGKAACAREGVSRRSASVSPGIFWFNLDRTREIGNRPVALTLRLQGITTQDVCIVICRLDRDRLADVGYGVIVISLACEAPRARDI